MANASRSQIKKLTVSAMLCALGVIVLALGAVIEVIDLSVAVIASLLCVYAVIEIGGAYPWLVWLVTSILSFLLIPIKTPVLFYAFFAGFYPILKEKIERLPRLPSWGGKLVVFHLCLGAIYLIMHLFLPALLEGTEVWFMLLGLYALSLVCFVLYDIALTRLITFYLIRLRQRFHLR